MYILYYSEFPLLRDSSGIIYLVEIKNFFVENIVNKTKK